MVQSQKQGKYMAVFYAVLYLLHLHVRIQEFSPSGGGGLEGPGPPDSKKLGQRCFVIFAVFLSSPSTYLKLHSL